MFFSALRVVVDRACLSHAGGLNKATRTTPTMWKMY